MVWRKATGRNSRGLPSVDCRRLNYILLVSTTVVGAVHNPGLRLRIERGKRDTRAGTCCMLPMLRGTAADSVAGHPVIDHGSWIMESSIMDHRIIELSRITP